MKVSKSALFVPVVITLETQDEVDELYALLNCGAPIEAIIPNIGEHWRELLPFATKGSDAVLLKLQRLA